MAVWLKANGGPLALVVLGIGVAGVQNDYVGLALIVVGGLWFFLSRPGLQRKLPARFRLPEPPSPRIRIAAGGGPEFRRPIAITGGSLETLRQAEKGEATINRAEVTLLRVEEEDSAPASNVSVRLLSVIPPAAGVSFPIYLGYFSGGISRTFAKGDRDYVELVKVVETTKIRAFGGKMPPRYLGQHEEVTAEVEVLVDGHRVDHRYFLVRNHLSTRPDGVKTPSFDVDVREVPVLNKPG